MAKIEFEINRESQLYDKAMLEVIELPECKAYYRTF